MNEIIFTKSAKQTQKIASNLSRRILKSNPAGKAAVIGLIGDLGSGKTVFAKGFAKGLGVKENIVSPTFVIERVYRLKSKNYKLFIHIDAYRIEKSGEIMDLGFKDLVSDSKNIILIEWADRIKSILPKNCVRIKFEHAGKNKRKIAIKIPNV
jgi:tRNA threonylcarbamoyladenosine biosynthesis protein TsaE